MFRLQSYNIIFKNYYGRDKLHSMILIQVDFESGHWKSCDLEKNDDNIKFIKKLSRCITGNVNITDSAVVPI